MRWLAAGVLAAIVSSLFEVFVLGGLPPMARLDPLLLIILLVAPVLEESCKRLVAAVFATPWGLTGLAFGIMEGFGKLGGLEEGSGLGFIISVLFHWGLGRHAQAGAWPLQGAIGAHFLYNCVAVLTQLVLGDVSAWLMLGVAGLLLWASFHRDVDAAPAEP